MASLAKESPVPPASPAPPSGQPPPGDQPAAPGNPPVQVAVLVVPRPGLFDRLRAWCRLAYTDEASREHRILLELIIAAVIVTVVATVLQHDHELEAQFHPLFLAAELVVVLFFVADYALNIAFAANRRAYILSISGIIDLLAILPSLLLLVDVSTIKLLRGLRFLRFLRVLQVSKAVRRGPLRTETEEEQSVLLDLQLGVIACAALLLLVPDNGLRNLMLIYVLAAAITVGARRMLVKHHHPSASAIILITSVVYAAYVAMSLDNGGQSGRAVAVVLATVLLALISWLRVEAPSGGL